MSDYQYYVSTQAITAIIPTVDNKNTVRLDKFLSNAGVLSRRGIKQLLKHQHITVNGKRVTESGTRIDPSKDIVLVNEQKIKKPGFVYYLLNKPMGVISTTSDEFDRDNVVSLIDTNERIYPIGRLDKDTHGLLILTNNGELTHKLTHPRYHVPKVYRLIVKGHVTDEQITAFQTGVLLRDGVTLPAQVQVLSEKHGKTTMLVTLHEGRNRQIRRMCEEVGINLLDLERISFGPIKIGNVALGNYRELSNSEIDLLKKAVGREIPKAS